MTTHDLWILTPEIVVTAAAVAIFVAGAFGSASFRSASFRPGASRGVWAWLAEGGIVAAMGFLACQSVEPLTGPLADDALALWTRWFALGVGLLLVMTAAQNREPDAPEQHGAILLTVAGLMLVGGTRELILLFLGLELVSIPTYLLLYLGRSGPGFQEATLKYFFLSVLSSAILLYGLTFLYGAAGSTDLRTIVARLAEAAGRGAPALGLAEIALVLVFAGLGFKLAAVPFHFYAPDVYQGATHLNAAFLSVVPKAAGVVALLRLAVEGMPGTEPCGWRIAMALAAVTMTYANVVALWQTNIRRLMAYSSISNAGFMLIGLAVGLAQGRGGPGENASAFSDGLSAMLFYLVVYGVATLGLFAALVHLSPRGRQIEHVDELAGLGRTRPGVAAALAVFLFSLAGIPPLAGFWGKLCVLAGSLGVATDPGGAAGPRPWFVGLAVLGVLNAAVAAAYYLRVVGVMYFRSPSHDPCPEGSRGAWTAMVLCVILTLAIGLHGGPLLDATQKASPAGPTRGEPRGPGSGPFFGGMTPPHRSRAGRKHGPDPLVVNSLEPT